MENVFENFTSTVMKINKLIQKIKLREMSAYGLKTVHAMCVYYLSQKGALTLSGLCKLTYEDKAAISRAVKLLKDKGYVNYDGESYNTPVTLTDGGKRLARDVSDMAERAVNAASCNFSEGERELFHNSLSHIENSLRAYYESISKGV